MRNSQKQLVICRPGYWGFTLAHDVELREDCITLPIGKSFGIICSNVIDSGDKGFKWSRVTLECELAEDSIIRSYAYASDTKAYGRHLDLCKHIAGLGKNKLDSLRDIFSPVGTDVDFSIDLSGRYLWLMFELISSGLPPSLSAIRLQMAGDHMMDYLPEMYSKDGGFTRRFLSVFDGIYMDMEREIYGIPAKLNYEIAEDEMLRFLASWVCIDPAGLKRQALIERIRSAFDDYENMYTVRGIKRSVEKLCSHTPIIIENMDAYPFRPGSVNTEHYGLLYGDNPYKFFILLKEGTFQDAAAMEKFLSDMRKLVPANTEFELVLLRQCVRLGGHTYLGVNTAVSDYTMVLIDENTTIRYDTMIGG